MELEKLIKKCKCGIYLTVNSHKDYYDSEEKKIKEVNELDFSQNGHHEDYEPEIDEETAKRMIKEKMIVNLQFYPDTPISSYSVWGTTLEEVLKKAEECFN